MRRVLLALSLIVAATAAAQQSGVPASGIARRFIRLTGAPPSCIEGDTYYDLTTHIDSVCTTAGTPGTWTTHGNGTVTSVGNGTIGPAFTASWATATTTPALSFNFATQSANCIFAGPTSGAAAVPTCRTAVDADLGSFVLNASFKTITVQPVTDVITATFRRDGAAQTSHFVDLQDELNNVLSFFDKSGVFNGNVLGNASTVTTNANLTGPITSTGNATAVASQTGTGTKFVMDTNPALVGPTANTLQTTGNVGFGVPPSGSVGQWITAQSASNQADLIVAKNTDAVDTGAKAVLRASANSDGTYVQMTAEGNGVIVSRFGVTVGGYSELISPAGNGLLIGTTVSAPLVAGTNNTRGLTISTAQAVSLKGTATNDNALAGDYGEFTNAQCPGPTTTATITVTIASPGVVTWTGHPFSGTAPRFDACPVVFTTTGALPTGITAGTTYWVIPSTISGNNFSIATSVANAIAGTAIATSGTQSGVQTGTAGSVLTTATSKDVTGLPLTAGDWDCTASLVRGLGATTSVTMLKSSISTTSATDGTLPDGTMSQWSEAASVPANDMSKGVGPVRHLLSGTTNVFLVADDTFTVSSNKAYGTLRCRRMR